MPVILKDMPHLYNWWDDEMKWSYIVNVYIVHFKNTVSSTNLLDCKRIPMIEITTQTGQNKTLIV